MLTPMTDPTQPEQQPTDDELAEEELDRVSGGRTRLPELSPPPPPAGPVPVPYPNVVKND